MIKLTELLHTIVSEKEEGMTPIDNWKITDADYMYDMGFTADGMFTFSLKNPKINVTHKKDVGFIIKDKNKTYQLTKFSEVMSFFEKYNQNWERQPYK